MNGLTIFSCPKAFNDAYGVIQRNAIRSWKLLKPEPRIILFSDNRGKESVREAAIELGVEFGGAAKCNGHGTPLVNDLWKRAEKKAETRLLAYVNADILLLQDWADAVLSIELDKFLAIGRRWDWQKPEKIDFDSLWKERLRDKADCAGEWHSPGGLDYFVFTRGLYKKVQPFALGRFAWDNWLAAEALRTKAAVVDMTEAATAIHQFHWYGEDGKLTADELGNGAEADKNRELYRSLFRYGATLKNTTHHVIKIDGQCVVRPKEPAQIAHEHLTYRSDTTPGLTIFTCPRNFNDAFGLIQRNALESWTRLEPAPRIVLLGDDDGVAETARKLGCDHIPELRLNGKGTPYVDSVWSEILGRTKTVVTAYVNADIILLQDFMDTIGLFSDRRFLLVGHRRLWENPKRLDFGKDGWDAELRETKFEVSDYSNGGSDYFVFTDGIFVRPIPPFLLGRNEWDRWLMGEGIYVKAMTVDCTLDITAVHQKHGYGPDGKLTPQELFATDEGGVNDKHKRRAFVSLGTLPHRTMNGAVYRNKTEKVELADDCRIYAGPFKTGKVNLTYHKGKIERGQKIRVTPDEAMAMDKLPKQWRKKELQKHGWVKISLTKTVKRKTKRKRRKGGK